MASRSRIVLGNWKMNGSRSSIRALCAGLRERIDTSKLAGQNIEVGVFPPFAYLDFVVRELDGCGIHLGAQDISTHDAGAFTGEVSGAMLADIGCTSVLVGHSERRTLHRESNEEVALKLAAVLKHGLRPVLCVGETLSERDGGNAQKVIAAQLAAVVAQNGAEGIGRTVLAYEPVWAVGTGRNATPEQAQEMQAFIRDWIAAATSRALADTLTIQYGGSVKASNAVQIFSMPDVDGGLIGGASLDAAEFAAIVAAAA